MASDALALSRAYAKFGPSVDAIAARYVNPVTGKPLSGAALLAKLVSGESGGRGSAVSNVGAKGFAQFMPSSRATAIQKFGVDPWASPEQAVHAASLHLRGHINGSTGLEGYNPGGGRQYVDYILGQHVGAQRHSGGGSSSSGASRSSSAVAPVSRTTVTGDGFSPGEPQQAGTLAARLAQPAQVQSTAPALPSFAAGPALPAGYRPVPTSGASPVAAAEPDVAAQGQSLPADPVVTTTQGRATRPSTAPAGSRGGSTGKRGRVVLVPGTESGGKLQKPLLAFLGEVAGRSGRAIKVTTGTNHNKFVSGTNRISDHFGGNAADLGLGGDARSSPAVSGAGDKIAAHAIQVATGWSYSRSLALARQGGIHNLSVGGNRVQIIWKAADHFDHVHIGVAPR